MVWGLWLRVRGAEGLEGLGFWGFRLFGGWTWQQQKPSILNHRFDCRSISDLRRHYLELQQWLKMKSKV